jgi:hypothetical protein
MDDVLGFPDGMDEKLGFSEGLGDTVINGTLTVVGIYVGKSTQYSSLTPQYPCTLQQQLPALQSANLRQSLSDTHSPPEPSGLPQYWLPFPQ